MAKPAMQSRPAPVSDEPTGNGVSTVTERQHHGKSKQIVYHSWLSILVLLTHAALGGIALTIFFGLEKYVHWLHGDHEPMVLGVVKLSVILEGGDALLVIGIVLVGLQQAFLILRGKE